MLSILDKPTDIPAHLRYHFKPLRGSSHSWALGHLREDISNRKVLDIGAGSGGIGKALQGRSPKELVAVEIDTRSHITLSSSYDRVLSDITPLQGEQFDWVVALDVLEHLRHPLQYLQELRMLLAPRGKIVISVPNVAHWSVRFPLFFMGSFEYRSLGIMDGSHLHFFSRKGFKRLLREIPNCSLKELSASIEPFELALPGWAWNNPLYRGLLPVRQAFARSLPGLFAYQHLAVMQSDL